MKAYRQVYQSGGFGPGPEYNAVMRAAFHYGRSSIPVLPGYLKFGFTTNPDGDKQSTFHVRVDTDEFEYVAKEMMKADPQAAIKAFAAAIHDAKITVQPDAEEETKAA